MARWSSASSIYEAVGRSIYMEINTAVQTAAMLRGGEVTYYDAAGELRATGRAATSRASGTCGRPTLREGWLLQAEFQGRMFTQGGGGGEAWRGRGGRRTRRGGRVAQAAADAAARAPPE